MKRILFFIAILASSCTTYKYGSKVTIDERSAKCSVEYKSYNYLVEEVKEKSSVQMWDEKTINRKIRLIPEGGYLIINVRALTIDAANTKYWTYVIQDLEGNEIHREKGADDIPEYTSSQYGTTWWNIDIISIAWNIDGPFKVFVIDNLLNKRSSFTVYPE